MLHVIYYLHHNVYKTFHVINLYDIAYFLSPLKLAIFNLSSFYMMNLKFRVRIFECRNFN